MKTVYMICSVATPPFNLESLRASNTRWVMLVNKHLYTEIKTEVRVFFDEIIIVEEFTTEKVIQLIKSITPDIDPLKISILAATEASMMLAAKIREHLDLPGDLPDYVLRFTDKSVMKNILANTDVNLPKSIIYSKNDFHNKDEALESIEKAIGSYPIFYKPLNAYGSYDVGKINDTYELKEWIKSSGDKTYILEEFLEGIIYHIDSVVFDGKILIEFAAEYINPPSKINDGEAIGSFVVPPESEIFHKLKKENEKVIAAMQPNNCVTHLEMFKVADGRLIFIEIAARAPGISCSIMHNFQWGLDLRLLHMKCQLNLKPQIEIKASTDYYAWAHVPVSRGRVKEINMPKLSSHTEEEWFIDVGDYFDESYFSQDESLMSHKRYAALDFIYKNESYNNLKKDSELIATYSFVIYDKDF